MKRFFFALCFPLFLTACDSTNTQCDESADCLPPPATVFVGNQGNFSASDGSVTVYDPASEETLKSIDNLASIVQSVSVVFGQLYVTANTGGRVEVYDGTSGDYERTGRIEVENPRYVAVVGEVGKVYVTSQLYNRPSRVVVADATTFAVTKTVEVGGAAEGIVQVGNRVFVATGAFGLSQEVVVIDTASDEVVQRIDVGCTAPRSLVADPFDAEVWVFCAGSPAFEDAPEEEGEVVVLNAADGSVVTRIDIDGRIDTAGPGQDAFTSAIGIFAVRDQNTVLRFDMGANTLVAAIPVDGDPIGAVAYDGLYERLYLARVPGFDVAGSVTIHEPDGVQVGQFAAGAAPTSIALLQ